MQLSLNVKTPDGTEIAELGFYVAVAALLVLFFLKKYRQSKNIGKIEKEDHNNKP